LHKTTVVAFDKTDTTTEGVLAPRSFSAQTSLKNVQPDARVSVDRIRPSAKEVVAKLRTLGLRTVMIAFDKTEVAELIAAEVGIDEFFVEVLPDQKAEIVKKLQRVDGEKTHVVVFVGDGINDAPALATADVGITVRTGTDVATQSADVVLVQDDLGAVVRAIELSRRTIRNIKQSLFWAFGYKCLEYQLRLDYLLYTFGGPLLNPMVAALMMTLSSLCVLLNALRLKYSRSL
jgi:Cu+-exporting ATPase